MTSAIDTFALNNALHDLVGVSALLVNLSSVAEDDGCQIHHHSLYLLADVVGDIHNKIAKATRQDGASDAAKEEVRS